MTAAGRLRSPSGAVPASSGAVDADAMQSNTDNSCGTGAWLAQALRQRAARADRHRQSRYHARATRITLRDLVSYWRAVR